MKLAPRRTLLLLVLGLAQCAAAAETYVATPASYLGLLRKLRPGDTLMLSPGRYLDGLPLHDINGAPGNAIVIRSSRDAPATLVAQANSNTISISNSSHVEVRDLVLDGEGRFVDAVKAEGTSAWASHIVIAGLTIRHYGKNQQLNGISTKCPAWGWVIRNNVIIGAGTGMYLGQSDGTAPFVGGLIEHNLIVDSIGYNVQIKHQVERPRIPGMPEGKSITVIRHNVFSKSANSSVGKLARPNLLVGHWPQSGAGVDDTYAIYGNFFYQNPTEALFQGEGNVAFYSNVLINAFGDAVNIQPHNGLPRRIDVFRNTVLAAATGIRISGGDTAYPQRIALNAVFAAVPIVGDQPYANVSAPVAAAPNYLTAPSAPLGQLNFAPRQGMLNIAPYSYMPQTPVPDWTLDFDGNPFVLSFAGAYAGESGARPLALRIKP